MPKVRTRKRGKTWSYVFEAGRKEDGKRRVIEKGGYPSKEAAYDAGTAAYTDWKHGNIGITSENITVKDFLESWLQNVAKVNVKPTTWGGYEVVIRTRIAPYFVGKTIQELTPVLIDKWMRDLLAEGLAKNSLSVARSLLHHALDYAVHPAGLIPNNPVIYVKVPKSAPTEIIERHIISRERFQELLEKYSFGHPMHIPLLILYHTGVRIGEFAGLTWEAVDLERKTITIFQQLAYIKQEQALFFITPKNKSSVRRFVIDDVLAQKLKQMKEFQEANEKRQGGSYVYCYKTPAGKFFQCSKGIMPEESAVRIHPVSTWEDGRIVKKSYVTHILTREGLNAHSFRHTHATLLIENGAPAKGVAGRLGHTNTMITQNLYTHNTEKLQEDTASIFQKTMQTKTDFRQNADNEEPEAFNDEDWDWLS